MKTLTEQYPDYKKRDTVISKAARDFVAYMANEGYNVAQMKAAVSMAETYINIEVKAAHINPPEIVRCTYSAHWEVDEDGNPKRRKEPPTAATEGGTD